MTVHEICSAETLKNIIYVNESAFNETGFIVCKLVQENRQQIQQALKKRPLDYYH
jgi:hypothetical protein